MAGNAWEWVSDLYDLYPGGEAYLGWAVGQENRVLRGGSWGSSMDFIKVDVRSALRHFAHPIYSDSNIGFRCAMDAPKK